ncbi:hypothetical protein J6590_031149 [Homalodisca vitripennis]|nr:hypothetical protein J6590_031149 [Homalodisca vitripennis]
MDLRSKAKKKEITICPLCDRMVLESDEGVLCDGPCSVWYHRLCMGMTADHYSKINKQAMKIIQDRDVEILHLKRKIENFEKNTRKCDETPETLMNDQGVSNYHVQKLNNVLKDLSELSNGQQMMDQRLSLMEIKLSSLMETDFETAPKSPAPQIPDDPYFIVKQKKCVKRIPPCTAKLLKEGETFEDFFNNNLEEFLRMQKTSKAVEENGKKRSELLNSHVTERSTSDIVEEFHENVSAPIPREESMLKTSFLGEALTIKEKWKQRAKRGRHFAKHYNKGGVAIFKHVNNENEINSLEIEHHSIPLIVEVSAVTISLSKSRFVYILGVYRPPRKNKASITLALQTLENTLKLWTSPNVSIVIIGDFNIDCLDPSTEKKELEDVLATFNIHRLLLPPTRITSVSSSSINMCCVTQDLSDIVKVRVVNEGISDHSGQICELGLTMVRTEQQVPTVCRTINSNNLTNLKTLLANQD